MHPAVGFRTVVNCLKIQTKKMLKGYHHSTLDKSMCDLISCEGGFQYSSMRSVPSKNQVELQSFPESSFSSATFLQVSLTADIHL